jgi:acyl carrier protein
MTEAEIWTQLVGVFRDLFDDDALELRKDTTADDVEDWDSLSHINLIVAIERSFGVKFTTTEVQSLRNVGELAALVAAKRR